MRLKAKKIIGVKVTVSPEGAILEELGKYLKLGKRVKGKGVRKRVKPVVIFTPNPEIILYAAKKPAFRGIVNTAQINMPDGAGTVWALKKSKNIQISRIPGVDFVKTLTKLSGDLAVRTGVIGGEERVALRAIKCLRKEYPRYRGEALDNARISFRFPVTGYRKETHLDSCFIIQDSRGREIDTRKYFDGIVQKIIKKRIRIVFVALGFPKQELYIRNIESRIMNYGFKEPVILMAVGGSMDYISGKVQRAPEWIRERGLEWLYRLVSEPWRWRRQLAGLEFFLRVIAGGKV